MAKVTFWNLPLGKEGKVVARELGRNGLVLAGFSVTTIAFLLGQYAALFQNDLLPVKLILVSLALYFLVSELARNAIYYREYALADFSYVSASIVLFVAISLIIYKLQLGAEILSLFAVVVVLLGASLMSSLWGFWRMYRQDFKKHKG
jgi:hypothetical protein